MRARRVERGNENASEFPLFVSYTLSEEETKLECENSKALKTTGHELASEFGNY